MSSSSLTPANCGLMWKISDLEASTVVDLATATSLSVSSCPSPSRSRIPALPAGPRSLGLSLSNNLSTACSDFSARRPRQFSSAPRSTPVALTRFKMRQTVRSLTWHLRAITDTDWPAARAVTTAWRSFSEVDCEGLPRFGWDPAPGVTLFVNSLLGPSWSGSWILAFSAICPLWYNRFSYHLKSYIKWQICFKRKFSKMFPAESFQFQAERARAPLPLFDACTWQCFCGGATGFGLTLASRLTGLPRRPQCCSMAAIRSLLYCRHLRLLQTPAPRGSSSEP